MTGTDSEQRLAPLQTAPDSSPRFRRRWGLLAAALSLAVSYLTRMPGLTDWDSYEYTAQAINNSCSGLCLGRWWFDWFMHVAYVIGTSLGLDKLHGSDAMQVAVALMTAGAVAALMYWTFLLTRRMSAAIAAGMMALASAPLWASASAVMTEGPTLLTLMLAYAFWEKSLDRWSSRSAAATSAWALAAGLAFGLTVNMREPALMLCAWPVVSCFVDRPKGRWRLLALAVLGAMITLAIGVAMAREVWLTQIKIEEGASWFTPIIKHMEGYNQYMRGERFYYGWPPGKNVLYLLLHTWLSAPLMVIGSGAFAIWWTRGGRRLSRPMPMPARRMAALGMATLPYCLATWYNPDLSFNYRLALPLGWTLIPIAAAMIPTVLSDIWAKPSTPTCGDPLAARRTFACGCWIGLGVIVAAFFVWLQMGIHRDYCEYQEEVFQSVLTIPRDPSGGKVAVVGGPGVPMVMFLNQTDIRPDMVNIAPGFEATPENMRERMQAQLNLGRRVFVNLCDAYQTRPDGKNFEWTSTFEAVKRFHRVPLPGQQLFVEILPQPATTTATAPAR